jgi:triacylglycerol lipase
MILCLIVLLCVLAVCEPVHGCAQSGSKPLSGDYVVLIHGYGRTALSMKRLEWNLKKQGCHVINLNYHSSRLSVEALSETELRPLLESLDRDPMARIHFVTHSLGAIILRQYLSEHELKRLGRVVMLAPPNHGSAIVDHARASPFWRTFLGPALLELGTGPQDLPDKLGPVRFECGVIAGDRSLNPLLSGMLRGPNDGKVTVDSARIVGMEDFLVVHNSHTWLMWRESNIRQILGFLETGHFRHGSAGEDSRETGVSHAL